jgi:hypothetical protein
MERSTEITTQIAGHKERLDTICDMLRRNNDENHEDFGFLDLPESYALQQEKNFLFDRIEKLEEELEALAS